MGAGRGWGRGGGVTGDGGESEQYEGQRMGGVE